MWLRHLANRMAALSAPPTSRRRDQAKLDGTKAYLIADGRIAPSHSAWQRARRRSWQLAQAVSLLDHLPGRPRQVPAAGGTTGGAFRKHIQNLAIRPVIPAKQYEPSVAYPRWI